MDQIEFDRRMAEVSKPNSMLLPDTRTEEKKAIDKKRNDAKWAEFRRKWREKGYIQFEKKAVEALEPFAHVFFDNPTSLHPPSLQPGYAG